MNIYRVLGDRIGTCEARELAEQLVVWHDAMVKHLRVATLRRGATCRDDCPHDEATLLWSATQQTFGTKAKDLTFLREHGGRPRTSTMPHVRDHAAEIRA
jgi:hypothetical protein